MIRSVHFSAEGVVKTDLPFPKIAKLLAAPQGILWLDVQGEAAEVTEPLLRETFHFHQLAIDDALRETHVPKLDDWEEYLYIVLQALSFESGINEIETQELDIFLGKNYMVTYHDFPLPPLERAWDACLKDPRYHRLGADHLLYKIADELMNEFMHTVDEIDQEIDHLEDQIFLEADRQTLQRVFSLKRTSLQLRRTLSPMREVFNKLARDDYKMVDQRDQVYFRDIYDHLVRLHDISESLRDLVSGALDTYLSVVNNRMNEVMKTLTIFTALFMPLSFIAGIFGMNFFLPDVPISSWMEKPVFIGVLASFVALPSLLFWVIRRRGWI